MHKHVLSLLLIFGACTYASAQTTTAPTNAAAVAPAAGITATDTIQAIHQLFKKHRTGGGIWLGIGAAFTGRIIGAAASSSGDSGGNAGGALVGIAVLGGGPAAIGIGKLSRFSATREAQVVSVYEQTKKLPIEIKKRLKLK